MTPPDLADAVDRFAACLQEEGLAPAAARIETILHGAGSLEPLLDLEAALRRAWPAEAGAAPAHELVWATGPRADGARVCLCAYDPEGRVLLRRAFGGDADA